ncbi:MAG: sigma-54 dependent transcriptional regulator [Pseudomonadota bacterium]
MTALKALIVDDEEGIRKTLGMVLSEKGYQVFTAADGQTGLRITEETRPEILVLDIRLPGMDGLEMLRQVRAKSVPITVIMITAFQDMETTVQAMKLGAFEYIHKPIDLVEFETAIDKIAESIRPSTKGDDTVREISQGYKVDDIVGKTDCMKEIFKIIGLVAGTAATVLIRGESGTGKELIARAIHRNSPRAGEPFVPVNCSTLVESLFESELFGHEKGSFTGASHQKKGKIELAQGGTIFLDEVGDITPAVQVKLLRFLQEREFERVGGEEIFRSSARIITATNRDLPALVAAKQFREDLYFRLNVLEVHVPPLRQRKSDIPLLVDHLLNKINTKMNRNVTRVRDDVMEMMIEYSWPGNVRELENVLTRSLVLCKGEVLMPDCLPRLLTIRSEPTREGESIKPLDTVVNEHVLRALQFTNWHKGEACRLLGISRPTLRRIMSRSDFEDRQS